jgi:nucleoid-associated protein YgaU
VRIRNGLTTRETGAQRPLATALGPAEIAMPDDEPDFSDVQGGSSTISHDTSVERTYTVRSGDSLSKIAKSLLGDAKRWREIYEANKDVVGNNPDLIHPGQVLKIPAS